MSRYQHSSYHHPSQARHISQAGIAHVSHNVADRQAQTAASSSSTSKRVRIDEPSRRQRKRDDTDFFDGDPEIEEQDLRRLRKDQKTGRIDDRGEDLSESDDEDDDNGVNIIDEDDSDADADGGSHRRRAEKKRRSDATGAAGDDDDEDMFDVADDDDSKSNPSGSKGKQKATAGDKYMKLGELEEGQDFGSTSRSGVDAADDDAELLRGSNGQYDDDLDPDLELEDEDDDGNDDEQEDDQVLDLNAYAERSPPTSPGGTPLPVSTSRKAKSRKSKVKAPKVTGFNMKEEMRSGKFDAEGNYHENQRDPHAQHDVWLTGVYSKNKILEARKAQQKRDQEAKEKEKEAERVDGDEDEVKQRLVEFMRRKETVQKTLQRLGKVLADKKKEEKAAAKAKQADASTREIEGGTKQAASDVETVTHLSSVLMSRFGRLDIYDLNYEQLLRDVHKSGLVRQTFDPAARFEPPPSPPPVATTNAATVSDTPAAPAPADDRTEWEYRWTPAYLAAVAREAGTPVDPEIETFGPFTLADLRDWAEQGYFGDNGERILLRPRDQKTLGLLTTRLSRCKTIVFCKAINYRMEVCVVVLYTVYILRLCDNCYLLSAFCGSLYALDCVHHFR